MKHIIRIGYICCILLIGTSTISFAQTNSQINRSFSITFNNQANNPTIKNVYLLLKGSIQGKSCFIRMKPLKNPNDQTVSACEYITKTTKVTDYAFDGINNVTFRVPPLSSGRMYISINKPLVMHINNDATVAEPSVYDNNPLSNPDYKTMFDKVEFTYNENGNTYFNPTAVDFLSLPVSISQHNHVFGLTTDRETAFATIQRTFNEEFNTNEYQRLTTKEGNTVLRILAPGREAQFFNPKYLDPYIDWLFNDYYFSQDGKVATHTMSLQLVEASGVVPEHPRILTPAEGIFSGFVKTLGNEKAFVFSNLLGDTITIKRSSMTSNSFFMAAMGNIDVNISPVVYQRIASVIKNQKDLNNALENLKNGYKAVIVKFISSAWAVGLLPTPNGDVIDQNYIRTKIGTDPAHIYQQRASLPAYLQNRGPWYQLYGKAIHLLTPHLYAFPYDDVLGLDGTNAENDSFPAVVTLHSMKNTNVL